MVEMPEPRHNYVLRQKLDQNHVQQQTKIPIAVLPSTHHVSALVGTES